MKIVVKRVYKPAERGDGTRVLVDRLWPRGLSKDRAAVDTWLRDVAPSDALRKWFHQGDGDWTSFRKRYLKELALPEAAAPLGELYRLAEKSPRVTLLFSSKDTERNNAVVLRDLLNGMRKPPTGTGHGEGAQRENPPDKTNARKVNKREADRLIAATALAVGVPFVTQDQNIRKSPLLKTSW